MDFLAEPLQHMFMVRGMAAAVLVGIVCAVVGTYVVLRGMAFMGSALSHSVVPGVAIGYLVGGGARGPLFWWALVTAILASIGIGAVSRGSRLKEDTAIGIIFAGMFALGIALISTVRSYSVDLVHFLFGNILAVTGDDLIRTSILSLLVIIVVVAFYKELLVVAFDPLLATTLRLPGRALYYLLMILIAVTIVVALQTVGIALLLAMLVTPPATALMLTKRLPVCITVAALIGALSGVVGLYVSYYTGIASGPAIVLVATAVFLAVFVLNRFRRPPTG